MRRARRAARFLGIAGASAVVLAAISSGVNRTVPAEAYVLLIGGLVLVQLVLIVRDAAPSVDPAAGGGWLVRLRPRAARPPTPPASLATLESVVAAGALNARAAHVRLRPHLHAIAADRLLDRRGIDLVAEPDRARAALGDEAYGFVAPEGSPPDRDDPGLPFATLARIVTTLEDL